jgi:hypothetical protein
MTQFRSDNASSGRVLFQETASDHYYYLFAYIGSGRTQELWAFVYFFTQLPLKHRNILCTGKIKARYFICKIRWLLICA